MRKEELIIIFIIISLAALAIEGSLVSFPIIFFLGSFMLFFFKKILIYFIVFLDAFIIDILRVVNFSYTPFFLLTTISLIFLYEKYSGSNDILVATLIILMVGFIYSHFMYYSLFSFVLFIFIALFFFFIIQMLKKRRMVV